MKICLIIAYKELGRLHLSNRMYPLNWDSFLPWLC